MFGHFGHTTRRTLIVSLLAMGGTAFACPPGETLPSSNNEQAKKAATTRQTIANAELQKDRSEKEEAQRKFIAQRDLQQIRHRHFTNVKNEAVRQQGMDRIRAMTNEPMNLPIILDVFSSDPIATRSAIVDMIASLKTEASDSTIAWVAMTESDKELKGLAKQRIDARVQERKGEVPHGVQSVIAAGLESNDHSFRANAANMALNLKLYEAIPSMIVAQAGPGGGGGVDTSKLAIAQIVIATQRAFVSDLTPVVGDSAVAFDPTISVVTEGVVLRVIDAVVIEYHTEVFHALNSLAEQGWDGRSTAHLGYDRNKWAAWYKDEFLPYRAALKAKADKAQQSVEPAKAGDTSVKSATL